MSLPNLLLALVIALLAGTLFHALRGGNGWRLLLCIVLSIAGFALAQWVGAEFRFVVYRVGILDIGSGVIGSILFLVTGDWLGRIEPRDKTSV